MFMSVDLPEPEGPITATNSPAPISRSTSDRPTTRPASASYSFVTPRSRRRGSMAASDRNAAPGGKVLDLQRGDHVLSGGHPRENLRPVPVRNPHRQVAPDGFSPRDDENELFRVTLHQCGGRDQRDVVLPAREDLDVHRHSETERPG